MKKIALIIFCLSLTFCNGNALLQASDNTRMFEEKSVTSSFNSLSTSLSSASIKLSLIDGDTLISSPKYLLAVDVTKITEINLINSIESGEIIIDGHSHKIKWSSSIADLHTIYKFFYINKGNAKIFFNEESVYPKYNSYKLIFQNSSASYIPFYLKCQFVESKDLSQDNHYYTTTTNLINTLYALPKNRILSLTNREKEVFQTPIKWDFLKEDYISPREENDKDIRQEISRFLIAKKDIIKITNGDKAGEFILSAEKFEKTYRFALTGNSAKKSLKNRS